jgi:hypothetical protein
MSRHISQNGEKFMPPQENLEVWGGQGTACQINARPNRPSDRDWQNFNVPAGQTLRHLDVHILKSYSYELESDEFFS